MLHSKNRKHCGLESTERNHHQAQPTKSLQSSPAGAEQDESAKAIKMALTLEITPPVLGFVLLIAVLEALCSAAIGVACYVFIKNRLELRRCNPRASSDRSAKVDNAVKKKGGKVILVVDPGTTAKSAEMNDLALLRAQAQTIADKPKEVMEEDVSYSPDSGSARSLTNVANSSLQQIFRGLSINQSRRSINVNRSVVSEAAGSAVAKT
eukprot:g78169.t1